MAVHRKFSAEGSGCWKAQGYKRAKERRNWGLRGLLPEKIFEILPFKSLENTLQILFRNECSINPKLKNSTNAVA